MIKCYNKECIGYNDEEHNNCDLYTQYDIEDCSKLKKEKIKSNNF